MFPQSKWLIDAGPILHDLPPHGYEKYKLYGSDIIGTQFDTRAEALAVEAAWLSRYLTTRHYCTWDNFTKQFT